MNKLIRIGLTLLWLWVLGALAYTFIQSFAYPIQTILASGAFIAVGIIGLLVIWKIPYYG